MNLARTVRGYVLAGGASSRFGTDKAFAELQGQTMLVRTAKLLARVTAHVKIVSPTAKLRAEEYETVADRWPGEGPLGGILTALADANEQDGEGANALIVSCDMPFLTAEWLHFVAERALASGAEAVIPKSSDGWEPLCAAWRGAAAEIIEPLFEAGTRKITEALNALRVEVLDEKDWKLFDTNGRLFWNMNTRADYEEALRAIAAEKL
ncbi:MAG: molybdenum cofactor guanylyltransferase [Acidobacteria bacterium]|nr:molybdenum cofactor guanylyltransferase [Acidobacteriota bacterium]MBS1866995.1 molybdenum cofactor guanylyltransferase [Acidobacteriota bacterium]